MSSAGKSPYPSQWTITLVVTEDMTLVEESRKAIMLHRLEHAIPGAIVRVTKMDKSP